MNSKVDETPHLLRQREQFVPRGLVTAHPLVIDRAQGAELWDVDGKRYLDFVGGIGVLNIGHNHPKVVAAVQAQLQRVSHACFQVVAYQPYLDLAQRLCEMIGGQEAYKAAFFTSGAEAVENAVKIARAHTNRSAVIAFRGGFHGRTLLGTTLTGMSQPYKQNFGPFAPEVFHTPYPNAYRGVTSDIALKALDELLATQVAPERVAAIIIEPVQGDGGFLTAPPEFLQALRALADKHGIVLILDEIQTGFGRTGTWFGFQHAGIQPDLVTVAKSLAGGLPLSGVVGKAHIMDAPLPGGLGGTYGGNALACAAALAVIDAFEQEQLLAALVARFGDIERISVGSSLKFCQLAEGSADFYPRLAPTSQWDTAAAQGVLEGAGGVVLNLQGEPLRYEARESLLNPFFLALPANVEWRELLVEEAKRLTPVN